jgi:tripartite ATP-independent transporter DctM subunit
MNVLVMILLMVACMLLLMASGLPIAFVLGFVGIVFGLILWGPAALDLVYFSVMDVMKNFLLVAIPLFIFMGFRLRDSGIADDLFAAIHKWSGGIKGALGMGTVVICAIIAAMAGVSGAATMSMGVIALPAMLRRKYDKRIAIGLVQAGGALGFLIPPSVMMIYYAFITGESVGQLFAAGLIPGLMLAFMYIIYIGVRCHLQPEMGPSLPIEERADWKEKLKMTRSLILPIGLVVLVLGSIFLGVTSPTEASAIGAFGAILCAAIRGRLTWSLLKNSSLETVKLAGFHFWMITGAIVYSKIFTGIGATAMLKSAITGLEVSPWIVLIIMQLSFFVLGTFLDDIAIIFICMPIYIPIITALGFNPVWFAILFIINMQMAYLTPPYGINLFYMRAVAPKEISLRDIYRSVVPFVTIQALGLAIIMIFPEIALYLPRLLFK